jgi:hypothetical protein
MQGGQLYLAFPLGFPVLSHPVPGLTQLKSLITPPLPSLSFALCLLWQQASLSVIELGRGD